MVRTLNPWMVYAWYHIQVPRKPDFTSKMMFTSWSPIITTFLSSQGYLHRPVALCGDHSREEPSIRAGKLFLFETWPANQAWNHHETTMKLNQPLIWWEITNCWNMTCRCLLFGVLPIFRHFSSVSCSQRERLAICKAQLVPRLPTWHNKSSRLDRELKTWWINMTDTSLTAVVFIMLPFLFLKNCFVFMLNMNRPRAVHIETWFKKIGAPYLKKNYLIKSVLWGPWFD